MTPNKLDLQQEPVKNQGDKLDPAVVEHAHASDKPKKNEGSAKFHGDKLEEALENRKL